MICLARLLGVPARYVCGYVYTGPKSHNTVQSEASHAWVQLYLPQIGWKGFDPTSGQVVGNHHIALAVSRHPESVPPVSGSFLVAAAANRQSPVISVVVVAEIPA